jgi:DNA-binding PucR family transcriptional regulator
VVARQIVPGEEVSAEERARRRDRLLRLAPARRLLLRGDVTSVDYRMVVALGRDDPRGLAIAARIAATIGRDVAVSRPFSRPEDRSAAEAEARSTLEAAEAIPTAQGISEAPASPPVDAFAEPSGAVERSARRARIRAALGDAAGSGSLRPGPRVLQAERLPAYRLLGELHNLPNGARLAGALLAPLLVGSVKSRRRHVATLRAVLEHPGTAGAAAALGIHRNTLLYRIARIEALTGWRLDDPELRLALAVAVRLVQNAQTRESVPG